MNYLNYQSHFNNFFITCSLHVLNLFMTCSQLVQNISTVFFHVHDLFTFSQFSSKLTHDLFRTFSHLFHNLFIIYLLLGHYLFMNFWSCNLLRTCSQFVHSLIHDLFLTYSQLIHDQFTIFYHSSTTCSCTCRTCSRLFFLQFFHILFITCLGLVHLSTASS